MIMRQSAAFPFFVFSHFHDFCGAPVSTVVDVCAVSVHSVPSRVPNFCTLVELPIAAVLRRLELALTTDRSCRRAQNFGYLLSGE
ncbi:Protein of unknown function [Pyronema omphalodes CBS 100304]|uniref:Uncharacterized protein n=1 Tax=Pyronema omphalodes (strain CBS 100304) TaxID=1076935 RepID=U4LIT5_PYROM|nr:Protein of unknown function [Pyronema omphalodes CBS 100304]